MTTHSSADAAIRAYRDWIGLSQPSLPAAKPLPQSRRVVVAGDFHVPFHSADALKALIREESARADVMVIAGDLLDLWSTSRWPKSRRLADPVSEFREGQAVLTLLAESFPRIVLMEGNHDQRTAKYLADRLPVDVMDYLRLTAPGALSPLRLMAEGMRNVEIAPRLQADHAEFGFLYQIGDCVISHAEVYSRIPNRAVSGSLVHWLMSFALPAGVIKPFRCAVQAHTHQAGTVHADYGVLAIENGSMCGVQEYQSDAKLRSVRPPVLGWSVITQAKGKTDLRQSRFIPLAA